MLMVACVQLESRLTLSTDWNRTTVWPTALTVTEVPVVSADQVEPPLVEV